ncbi:MAG TPA: polymer-forming cytoskeletal protein [Wenzhouxiangella sp.]
MFNKSGSSDNNTANEAVAERSRATRSPQGVAMVGASIHMDGRLSGEEDLLIEGKVTGTVDLKKNTVTVGSKGHVLADLYGKNIVLEGKVEGNIYAAESIVVRRSAHITGRLVAPAVSLEQGGYFSGTIDMDSETEDLKKSFAQAQSAPKPAPAPKAPEASETVAPLLKQPTKS